MKKHENLVRLFEFSIKNNWEITALSDYKGIDYTYREVGTRIMKIHAVFQACGVKKGDKIALVGKNSANWGIIYLAAVNYGAVIVPILPDFKPVDIHYIINHSDSVVLFAGDSLWEKLDPNAMTNLRTVLQIQDFSLLHVYEHGLESAINEAMQAFETRYPDGLSQEDIRFSECNNDDVAVISYTSGTTGFSKGVVLQHKSLLGNMNFAQLNMPLNPADKIVSFLPLAHTYGCAFEFLFPFTLGCHITFLTRTPSPKIVTDAFQEIQPALILSVPLVIEKIYKTRIMPLFHKRSMAILIRIPLINKLLYNKIRSKMFDVFGGNFRELIIGGAAFNPEAERFFRKMKFPFTVGYGMTECGPLISYASWRTTKLGASGRAVDELEVTIDSDDPQKLVGEILIRGSHVMQGYYKNPEATAQAIDNEGWLHSGDLGIIDSEGNIFIKGRSKSMILTGSGKNIYPEEIESFLNNRFMVSESVVVPRNNKLIALICPDYEAVKKAGLTESDLPAVFQRYINETNDRLPGYMNLSGFEIHAEEFEKTPKRSIKRFVYQ
ncbi:MAG: AMP-binding protein [Bacteroidales bacterium]|nr:AMP-binding protein [Bacteroidales bacterium]MDD3961420.1 AMP-binding protein [Bacteroidales bacterium]